MTITFLIGNTCHIPSFSSVTFSRLFMWGETHEGKDINISFPQPKNPFVNQLEQQERVTLLLPAKREAVLRSQVKNRSTSQTCLRPIFLQSHICLKFQKKG